MELPEGFRIDNHVARLNRCINGLRQSPGEWYFRLIEYILPHGFVSSKFDPCVLLHRSGNLIVAIYVDDIVFVGDQGKLIDEVVGLLKSGFEVNDMGTLHWLLGIQIERLSTGITLSQTAYIDRILAQFSMLDCNSVSTPMEPNQQLKAAVGGEPRGNVNLYQRMLGSIMCVVTGTRPDLAHTIAHLSQFSQNPSVSHTGVAKRVLRYLKGTKDLKPIYQFGSSLLPNGYCDASF
ncbi:hypothetical protein K3495_g9059 [Podosphaera aphanis]|nr:hypothetical protein K3495_g9059 [Podosphaera aphanis]